MVNPKTMNSTDKKTKKEERAKRKEAKHQTDDAELLAFIELRQNQCLMRIEDKKYELL